MNFDPIQFIYNLKYMGVGMAGILVVMAAIMGVIFVLGRIPTGDKKDED